VRVVVAMFSPVEGEAPALGRVPLGAGLLLGSLGVILFWLGVAPGPLQLLIRLSIARPLP
jgi:hypothetical protein